MNAFILKYLKSYSYDTYDVNRLLVSSFLNTYEIHNVKNIYIQSLIITEADEDEFVKLNEFSKLIGESEYGIEQLLELFEFVISPEDKEVNGAIYTPEYIREFIVDSSINSLDTDLVAQSKFGDIACGCGAFFKTIAKKIRDISGKSYFEIYRDNIFGIDIQEYSIERTKILLILYAIVNGEDKEEFNFNLILGNSLNFDWKLIPAIEENNGFDVIVGNPPYVGASKIDAESKKMLQTWSVSKSGKADLYIPFFEIGMENLRVGGILGYITVNTFYKSLNGRLVREYFSNNGFDLSIIDFANEQVFRGRSTYTCICIIKKNNSKIIKYCKTKSKKIKYLRDENYISIDYNQLNNHDGWYLVDAITKTNIDLIEKTGTSLGKLYEIRNGFATLKNNIYVFTPIREDGKFFYFLNDNFEYKIEKHICRPTIKPNTLKSEEEITKSTEQLIFPYTIGTEAIDLFSNSKRKLKIIEEDKLRSEFPLAYAYLVTQKKILAKRDKGNRQYEAWYAFGRNQALTIRGYKLFLPYITNAPCFVYSNDLDLLFYNGYAIISESEYELLILQKILMSKIFWYYVTNTSKPYSGEYFSVAKNYIKNFGIPILSPEQKDILLYESDTKKIDKFLAKLYNLSIF